MADPAIKLFGKTIPVTGDTQDSLLESNGSSNSSAQLDYADKELVEEETMDTKEESSNPPKEQETNDDSDQSDEKESSNDAKNSQQKHLKKPDKIVPCPRCKSMDTKFCYYNNHNVNQPRHFCKNCQRYWTAGGSMRNVPVGSGRRKNKTTTSFTISEPGLKSNGTLLTFGSENSLVESMLSSGSTVTTTSSMEDKGPQEQNLNQGFPNQLPCFQWPYMWSPPFCPSAFPMPFYPIPWNIHWVPPTQTSSPNLGKHSRDGEMLRSNESEKGSGNPTVLVPKTLRIDDPDEAAKSSIWTTLGINKEKGDSISKGGFFNSIHFKKGEEKDRKREASPALNANPAALCRYVTFQENTDIRT